MSTAAIEWQVKTPATEEPLTLAEADKLTPIPGYPPDALTMPSGCAFHPRCPLAFDTCRRVNPALLAHDGSLVACHAVNPVTTDTKAA